MHRKESNSLALFFGNSCIPDLPHILSYKRSLAYMTEKIWCTFRSDVFSISARQLYAS